MKSGYGLKAREKIVTKEEEKIIIQRQTIKINNIRKRVAIEKIGYPPSSDYYRAIMTVLQIIDDEVMKK